MSSSAAAAAALMTVVQVTLPASNALQGVSWVLVGALTVSAAVCHRGRHDARHRSATTAWCLLLLVIAVVWTWAPRLPTSHVGGAATVVVTTLATTQFRTVLAWSTVSAGSITALCVIGFPPTTSHVVDTSLTVACVLVLALVTSHLVNDHDRLTDALREVAAQDTVTGLVTRRVLDEALASALGAEGTGAGTALILVDVDYFKAVNDRHGHPVGDAVLRHVADVLNGAVRRGDGVVSRVGGDELAVLMTNCSPDAADARAGQLVELVRCSPMVLPSGTTIPVTVSVGVAHCTPGGLDIPTMYAASDHALYSAKRGGRDRHAVTSTVTGLTGGLLQG